MKLFSNQIRDRLWIQVSDQTMRSIKEQVRDQIWEQVWIEVWDQVWDKIVVEVCSPVKEQIWNNAMNRL